VFGISKLSPSFNCKHANHAANDIIQYTNIQTLAKYDDKLHWLTIDQGFTTQKHQ